MISCDVHDYFEHVCVLKKKVVLTLKNTETRCGIAADLIARDGEEYFILRAENQVLDIPLSEIKTLAYTSERGEETITVS